MNRKDHKERKEDGARRNNRPAEPTSSDADGKAGALFFPHAHALRGHAAWALCAPTCAGHPHARRAGLHCTPDRRNEYRRKEDPVVIMNLHEDWPSVTVEEIQAPHPYALATGPFGSSISSRYFVQSGVPVIRGSNLSDDSEVRLIDEGLVFISAEMAKEFARSIARQGDLVFTCWGTIGQVGLIDERSSYGEYVVSNKQMKFTPDPKKANSLFLYYLFSGPELSRRIRDSAIGSSVPGFNLGQLRALKFALPPLAKQQAIAAALGDADAYIDALAQRIAKQRLVKQGAMQELLTGKRRLPGFAGEWEVKRIGELANVDPDSLDSGTSPDYTFKYVSLDDVEVGILKGWSEIVFSQAPSRARRKIRKGDVLVATVRPNLQSHCMIRNEVADLICSTGFAVVRCNTEIAEPEYVYAHFFASHVGRQIERLIVGSNYPAINSSDVKHLEIPVPPTLSEQTAIAAVLGDMDAAIEALEAKLAKARLVKQGMMQELLTGRVRLV